MESSRLTEKSQATIPLAVRKRLGLKPGDRVGFEPLPDGSVRLCKVVPLDRAFLQALEGTVAAEWNSEADDRAFAEL